MYIAEAKTQQSKAVLKSMINSKKNLNNTQKSTNSITKITRTSKAPSKAKDTYQIKSYNQNKSKSASQDVIQAKLSKRITPTISVPNKLSINVTRESIIQDPSKKISFTLNSLTKTLPFYIQGSSNNVVSSNKKNRKEIQLNPNISKNSKNTTIEILPTPKSINMATQTNEGEILNHTLIVGDLKVIQPSKFVIDEIEKCRKDFETKRLLKATRKFEEHSQKDEKHLEDLKEFLEKSYITRKPHKVQNISLKDHKLIASSMDELLQRTEKPKIESITDIRARIKHKEKELLCLFNNFQKENGAF